MNEVLGGIAEYLKENGVIVDDSEFCGSNIIRLLSTVVPHVLRLSDDKIYLRAQLSSIDLITAADYRAAGQKAAILYLNDPECFPRLLKIIMDYTQC